MNNRAKPGECKITWGRLDRHGAPSLLYIHGAAGASKADARMLSHIFEGAKSEDGRTLAQDLEYRGYDLSTLKFSIQQRPAAFAAAKAVAK